METIEEIIEQEITEPLIEEPSHHTHHISHRTHRHHHHNGSIVMVSTQTGQLIHRSHELNNNGEQLIMY